MKQLAFSHVTSQRCAPLLPSDWLDTGSYMSTAGLGSSRALICRQFPPTSTPPHRHFANMKFLVVLLCLGFLALAFAAPEKRFFLDDLQKEAAKILQCEATLDQKLCEDCCASSTWYHPSEGTACTKACAILP